MKNKSCYLCTSIPRHTPCGLWQEWLIKHRIIIISSVVWYFLMFTRNSIWIAFYRLISAFNSFLYNNEAWRFFCHLSQTIPVLPQCTQFYWSLPASNTFLSNILLTLTCSCFSYSSAPIPAQSPTADAQGKIILLMIWKISLFVFNKTITILVVSYYWGCFLKNTFISMRIR